MDKIVEFGGHELRHLMADLQHIVAQADHVYRIRSTIDGGIKIKVNEDIWSPAMGTVYRAD